MRIAEFPESRLASNKHLLIVVSAILEDLTPILKSNDKILPER
jgi:hypothetical protein